VADRKKEGHSTGQNPQWVVVPMEEEEDICQGDTFRPSRSFSGPPRKTDPRVVSFSACWDPKCSQVSVTEAKVHKYTRLYTFASVIETCEHLGSQNAEKLTTLEFVFLFFLEGLRMTD